MNKEWEFSGIMFGGYRMFKELPSDKDGFIWADARLLTWREVLHYWIDGKLSLKRWFLDCSQEENYGEGKK